MQQDQASPDAGLDAAPGSSSRRPTGVSPRDVGGRLRVLHAPGLSGAGIEDEFEDFVRLIEADGYWRLWGLHRWRSLTVDDHVYWLHWNLCTVEERMIVNRWWRDRMAPEPAQLTMELDV